MGEAKRRQQALKTDYGKEATIFPWLPITESQLLKFYKIANKGAWIGIGVVLVAWVTVRFIGPFFGLWEVQY